MCVCGGGGGGEGGEGGGDKSYRTPSPHPTTPISTCTVWWHNCFVYISKVGIFILLTTKQYFFFHQLSFLSYCSKLPLKLSHIIHFLIMQINTKHLGKIFSRRHFDFFFFFFFFFFVIFHRIQDLISYADYLQWRQFA